VARFLSFALLSGLLCSEQNHSPAEKLKDVKLNLLHDAVEHSSVAAVDESVGDHSATFMVEQSREELGALTHLRCYSQDALKQQPEF